MKKQEYYWKVVKVKQNKYTSAIIDGGIYSVIYKVGHYVSASIKQNGLFVFETRDQARDFKKDYQDNKKFHIFKVKVKGAEIIDVLCYDITGMIDSDVLDVVSSSFPFGTHNFPEVMLVEKCY